MDRLLHKVTLSRVSAFIKSLYPEYQPQKIRKTRVFASKNQKRHSIYFKQKSTPNHAPAAALAVTLVSHFRFFDGRFR